jgi:uncharacterized membrane protein YdjX (TVP38/TMEM64 family)
VISTGVLSTFAGIAGGVGGGMAVVAMGAAVGSCYSIIGTLIGAGVAAYFVSKYSGEAYEKVCERFWFKDEEDDASEEVKAAKKAIV